jgi:hypothetical protein
MEILNHKKRVKRDRFAWQSARPGSTSTAEAALGLERLPRGQHVGISPAGLRCSIARWRKPI